MSVSLCPEASLDISRQLPALSDVGTGCQYVAYADLAPAGRSVASGSSRSDRSRPKSIPWMMPGVLLWSRGVMNSLTPGRYLVCGMKLARLAST